MEEKNIEVKADDFLNLVRLAVTGEKRSALFLARRMYSRIEKQDEHTGRLLWEAISWKNGDLFRDE